MRPNAWMARGLAWLVATMATTAAAYFHHDTHTWTAVSGYSGPYMREALVEQDTQAIFVIKGYEKADDPVRFELAVNSLVWNNTYNWGWLTLLVLPTYNVRSGKSVNVGQSRYIVALNVCTTDENDVAKRKIKGIRAWPGRLEWDLTVRADGPALEYTRPNCRRWRNKVSCPANAVVTGVRAFYKSLDKGFTGLKLRCSTIRQ